MARPVVIKKYGNRRLYDTEASRYITLDELAEKVRGGTDVRVVDVKSREDLTQATLTQIIVEGRGAAQLLPVGLLTRLIRLEDEALAEFLGQYMSAALELYLRARRGAEAVAPYNPLATLPFSAADALARLMVHPLQSLRGERQGEQAPQDPREENEEGEVAALRREIEELKNEVRTDSKRRRNRKRR